MYNPTKEERVYYHLFLFGKFTRLFSTDESIRFLICLSQQTKGPEKAVMSLTTLQK